MTILDQIFATKRKEVESLVQQRSLVDVQEATEQAVPPLDFPAAVGSRANQALPRLIAEIKFASPSKGILVQNPDPIRLARIYQANGAAAFSVLTDQRYFQGSLEYLTQVACLTPRLPVLRKDFIYDPYQVYEARAAGADAVLLIVAALEPKQLCTLHRLVLSLGMAALVEVHTMEELKIALRCEPRLLGINNRDLHSFKVDLEITERLRPQVPAGICLVAESGIRTHQDVLRLQQAGVDAILVGESLVTASDVGKKIQELLGKDEVL